MQKEQMMKRMTVTLNDDLEAALDAFSRDQAVPPQFAAIAQTALAEYLTQRGYLTKRRPLRITPADHGSDDARGSVEHDRIFAEATRGA
jgi:hypothetical protein